MKNIDEKAIINRIIELRRGYAGDRGKSKFAKAITISPSTYNYYEKDRLPPIPVLVKICEITKTDIYWLLTGKFSDFSANTGVDGELMAKIANLLRLNPESGATVSAFIDLLSDKNIFEQHTISSEPQSNSDRPGWIPVLGRTAAGVVHLWEEADLPGSENAIVDLDQLVEKHTGRTIVSSKSGDIAIDMQVEPLLRDLTSSVVNLIQVSASGKDYRTGQVVEFVECEQIHTLFPDAFALQVDGDSMHPRINDGDIVIMSPSVPAAQGHLAVARVANQIGVTCKLIRSTESFVHLIPINERYEAKTVAKEDMLWALAVLCHIKI